MENFKPTSVCEEHRLMTFQVGEVVKKLDHINDKLDSYKNLTDEKIDMLQLTINKLDVAFGKLDVKSGMWGILGGAVPAVVVIVLMAINALWKK